MSRFELLEPKSLEGALALMAREGQDVPIMAGGIALMILIKQRITRPKRIISLRKLRELRDLSHQDGTGLRIGALVTHRAVETSPLVLEKFPVLAETEHHVANVRIRNMGTIGGELSHGDPHSDPAPVLVGLRASIRCVGPGDASTERTMPMSEFFRDYMETALQPGELMAKVLIPDMPDGLRAVYLKHTTSTSTDWPVLGVAAFGRPAEDGQMGEVRVVLGSVETTPREIPGVSDLTAGKAGGPELFQEVGEYVASQIEPIDDGRASPWYKKELAKVYVRRALERIWAGK